MVDVISVVGLWLVVVTVLSVLGAVGPKAWTRWRTTRRRTTVLIMVEQPFEATSVRQAVGKRRQAQQRKWSRHPGVEKIATIGRARLLLAEPGRGAALADAAGLYARVRPDYVVVAGVCRGLHPDRQRVGDVIVAIGMLPVGMAHPRPEQAPLPAAARLVARGDTNWASRVLVSVFCAAAPPARDHHFRTDTGILLCHDDLAESWTLGDDLAAVDQHAAGAAPGQAATYIAAATKDRRVAGWAMVMGVAWYGQYRTDQNNQIAADNAASLIMEAAVGGLLDPVGPN